jgi:hypothetical protein
MSGNSDIEKGNFAVKAGLAQVSNSRLFPFLTEKIKRAKSVTHF